MSATDEVLDLLEKHLSALTEMDNDGVDDEDPRREEWQISAGIILMGLPFWADVLTVEQRTRITELVADHGE